ncbi:putative beta-lysine N-acetyltransferase [Alkalihalobacillus sp. BA299]|uniref:putative beta-lysine N-acetyltransferase n=1 Tax=Alkalihalobacillus sp. BA299 TaxID=2815938 RepID=UPI001ADB0CBB|nr:putative beta-lysine N-acetyltransferase [Alkalihalobacillus sp. BA299]
MKNSNIFHISQCESGVNYTINIYIDITNRRLRVDDYRGNVSSIMKRVVEIAKEYSFTKVIIKSKDGDWRKFLSYGYQLEGIIEGFFSGSDAYFMSYYFSDERRTSHYWKEEDDIINSVLELPNNEPIQLLPSIYKMRLATQDDASDLAKLYHHVFPSYPTPMNEKSYIEKVMDEGTIFYLVEWNSEIVSAASAEVNAHYQNAEMTDCATLKEHRKYGFMKLLITELEKYLIEQNIYCAYSLARARSFGMNAVFGKLGYQYNGRLTKNCDIFGEFEDMNIWVKKLV